MKTAVAKNIRKESVTKFEKALINYYAFIDKRNLKFRKLTRVKRIVALCEDALYHILAGVYEVEKDSYCKIDLENENEIEIVEKLKPNKFSTRIANSAKNYLPVSTCEVCAKGALFISAISFKNKLSIIDAQGFHGGHNDLIKSEFTKDEWNLIEAIFEMDNSFVKNKSNEYSSPFIYPKLFTKKLFIEIFDLANFKYVNNEDHCYGAMYEIKHFKKYYSFGTISHNDSYMILIQMLCAIIHNKGDVFTALSLKNDKIINYKKIIDSILKKYPVINQYNKPKINNFYKQVLKKPLPESKVYKDQEHR